MSLEAFGYPLAPRDPRPEREADHDAASQILGAMSRSGEVGRSPVGTAAAAAAVAASTSGSIEASHSTARLAPGLASRSAPDADGCAAAGARPAV